MFHGNFIALNGPDASLDALISGDHDDAPSLNTVRHMPVVRRRGLRSMADRHYAADDNDAYDSAVGDGGIRTDRAVQAVRR